MCARVRARACAFVSQLVYVSVSVYVCVCVCVCVEGGCVRACECVRAFVRARFALRNLQYPKTILNTWDF